MDGRYAHLLQSSLFHAKITPISHGFVPNSTKLPFAAFRPSISLVDNSLLLIQSSLATANKDNALVHLHCERHASRNFKASKMHHDQAEVNLKSSLISVKHTPIAAVHLAIKLRGH